VKVIEAVGSDEMVVTPRHSGYRAFYLSFGR